MTPLQHLTELNLQNSRTLYPNLPEYARVQKKYTDKTEKALIGCITDFCKFTGNYAERINNRGFKKDNRQVVENCLGQMKTIGSVEWIRSGQTPGTADISAIIKGKPVKIEIKIGKDRQSEAQKRYQQMIEKAGGEYWIVHTFNEFYSKFSQIMKNP